MMGRALLLLLAALAPAAFAPGSPVFFRAEFDGSAEATLRGAKLAPSKAEGVSFEASERGQALAAGPGTALRYELGPGFPRQAGTLEIRLKPRFPQTEDGPAREVLRLVGGGDSQTALSYAPKGRRWVMDNKGQKWSVAMTYWHGQVKEGAWSHLVMTWDRENDRVFSIFRDGQWVETRPFDGRFGEFSALEIGGPGDPACSLDAVAVYDRCLTKPQVAALAAAFPAEGDRAEALGRRLAEDDRAAAARAALVAKLDGKVGHVLHTRGREAGLVDFPEGVKGQAIRPEDIGKTDLSRFRVIHFPMGPKFEIEPAQYPAIVEFVEKGGGYVGCCQGAFFAEKTKLLDIKCHPMDVWGLYNIQLRPHFVTDGRSGVIRMHFGNGPVMVAGQGCETLGEYLLGFPGARPSAIVTGKRGQGTVVLFGTHPLGDSVSYKGTRAFFSGKLLDTDVMFVNALLYASGLTDAQGKPVEDAKP